MNNDVAPTQGVVNAEAPPVVSAPTAVEPNGQSPNVLDGLLQKLGELRAGNKPTSAETQFGGVGVTQPAAVVETPVSVAPQLPQEPNFTNPQPVSYAEPTQVAPVIPGVVSSEPAFQAADTTTVSQGLGVVPAQSAETTVQTPVVPLAEPFAPTPEVSQSVIPTVDTSVPQPGVEPVVTPVIEAAAQSVTPEVDNRKAQVKQLIDQSTEDLLAKIDEMWQ